MDYLERRTGCVVNSRTERRETPTPGTRPSVALAWTLFLPAAGLVLCLNVLAQASGPLEDENVVEDHLTLSGDVDVERSVWNPVMDRVQAGAAKVSIEPDPVAYDGHWEKENCDIDLGHLDNTRTFFPTNPDCIYIWGIGPNTPAVGWNDELGLWARSVAIANDSRTVVLTMLDGFYWFGEYASFCDGCGGMQLAEELAERHGFDPAGFFLHATHSHAAPDFIGSGGGVPDWYMRQVTDAIRQSVDEAIANMRPAVLEAGEELVRDLNSERRDTYYSAEESGLSWFRAVGLDPNDDQPNPTDVIATVGAYAMHPVTKGDNDGIAHPDWPGLFVQRAEERFGGLAFFFQTGLGQMSTTSSHIPEGDRFFVGRHLAERIPPAGEGQPVVEPEIRTARRIWNHPATNLVSTSTVAAGLFDRQLGGPAAIQVGRHEQRQCTAASGTSVRTQVSAARIGSMVITGGPGELFANLTNTIKEHNAAGVTLPLSLINDGLGYIMQDFEAEQIYGQNVPGVAGAGPGEYEEVFGNECLGDAVLQYTLELFGEIR